MKNWTSSSPIIPNCDGHRICVTEGGKFTADIDYTAMRSKNYQELECQYLVDLKNEYFLVVDKICRPSMGVVDVATRQRLGSKQAGDHLPQVAHKHSSKQDSFPLEQKINKTVFGLNPADNSHLYHVAQHGGGGASAVSGRKLFLRLAQQAVAAEPATYAEPERNAKTTGCGLLREAHAQIEQYGCHC